MIVDFVASKLRKSLADAESPFHAEVAGILYDKYLAGEVAVQFIDGEPLFSLAQPQGRQLELPLEYKSCNEIEAS